jgi:hypothetical protein
LGIKKLIGNPLNNVQITTILKRKMKNGFKGCFARNDLPKNLENGYYVLNLDDDEGTHWTGFIVSKNEIEYFDPFGFQPPNELIAKKGDRRIIFSTHSLQNLVSVSCGLWVIFYLSERYKGVDKMNLLLNFENNGSRKNEKKLEKWVFKNLT